MIRDCKQQRDCRGSPDWLAPLQERLHVPTLAQESARQSFPAV